MIYYERVWLKIFIKLFNYYHLINDIWKIKNLYINKNGHKNSERVLISKLKSQYKVYLTNKICESFMEKLLIIY